jgi:hypothetical protein
MSAFQDTGPKESVLKVQSTAEGELSNLVEDFSEGRIQFAFIKVKDPNSGLPKCVLIGWCGGGVPERTKGYYTSHLAAVAKMLHGYHVQITARSEGDLVPESIIQKVADASGAKYSAGLGAPTPAPVRPPVASKPVFTPTSLNRIALVAPTVAARARTDFNVDKDGWGDDAPPVTRSQLERVEPAYKPTKVNMADLVAQGTQQSLSSTSVLAAHQSELQQYDNVVKGGYQPVGKVDIAAIRAKAQSCGDDRPVPVKGAYEPIGKVDIAAIKAQVKPRPGPDDEVEASSNQKLPRDGQQSPEPLVSLSKPTVAKKFGSSPAFIGTKPPVPTPLGFSGTATPAVAALGAASRTFADEGGKTPAQIWAEKKAKEKGSSSTTSASMAGPQTSTSPAVTRSNDGEWKSGYKGKSWAPVQTAPYGRSLTAQKTGEEDSCAFADTNEMENVPISPSGGGGISALRDRFKGAHPIGIAASVAQPTMTASDSIRSSGATQVDVTLPDDPTISPVPDANDGHHGAQLEDSGLTDPQSPVRIAIPAARAEIVNRESPMDHSPSPLAPISVNSGYLPEGPSVKADDEAAQLPRDASSYTTDRLRLSDNGSDHEPEQPLVPPVSSGGLDAIHARVQYDYEKAEDNEVQLEAGDLVTDIEMVDEDWWLGTNSRGERGLFPSNYVELIDGGIVPGTSGAANVIEPAGLGPQLDVTPAPPQPTATALFDYEAAEDNEIGFPEGAKITNLEFPDEDWWFGTYDGKSGLFPANYVQLNP